MPTTTSETELLNLEQYGLPGRVMEVLQEFVEKDLATVVEEVRDLLAGLQGNQILTKDVVNPYTRRLVESALNQGLQVALNTVVPAELQGGSIEGLRVAEGEWFHEYQNPPQLGEGEDRISLLRFGKPARTRNQDNITSAGWTHVTDLSVRESQLGSLFTATGDSPMPVCIREPIMFQDVYSILVPSTVEPSESEGGAITTESSFSVIGNPEGSVLAIAAVEKIAEHLTEALSSVVMAEISKVQDQVEA